MNWTTCRAFACLSALALTGCSQFTTSTAERVGLQATADAADAAYLDCLGKEADRYLGTSEEVSAIVTIARKNCAGTRAAAGEAQSALQSTSYILSEREVAATLKSLDEKGEAAITGQVLNRRATAPAAATPAPVTLAAAASLPSPGSAAYLACMRDQGERWANVQEPAGVIADAAHGRCAPSAGGTGPGADAEQQGRAVVIGLVLDRKVQAATPAPGTRP